MYILYNLIATPYPPPYPCAILLNINVLLLQMDDEPFNPDYVEVDRVLDVSESTDENGEVSPDSIVYGRPYIPTYYFS